MTKKRDDPDTALEAIKNIHRRGGRELSLAEAIEFILMPVERTRWEPPKRRRGPKSKRLKPDYDPRRGVFHKLVRLKSNLPKAVQTRRRAGVPTRNLVDAAARELIDEGVAPTVSAVKKKLDLALKIPPSGRTVRRHLEALEHIKPASK